MHAGGVADDADADDFAECGEEVVQNFFVDACEQRSIGR